MIVCVAALGLATCEDSAVEGAVAQGGDLGPTVIAFCRANMSSTDCSCFWTRAAPAFNAGNVGPILAALAERDRVGPMLTRGRLERFAGEDETRRIGRALYDCVDIR